MKLEICANSIESAENAIKAKADRIELCCNLTNGGLTPSFGTLKSVMKISDIPIRVLIRPSAGGFCYSHEEFSMIKEDIKICKTLNLEGIVSGVLNSNSTIDLERTEELIKLAHPLKFTFHRAFDLVKDPFLALEQLIDLGVDTILSSGLQETAVDGITLLQQLKEKAGEKITIMPGSGINSTNIKEFKELGFKYVHSSASRVKNKNNLKSYLFGNVHATVSDLELIREMNVIIND